MAGRGQLTEEVQEIARKFLGREMPQLELRLIPYVQYRLVNDQRLDPKKVSTEERKVLSQWRKAGYLEGGASEMEVTKEFWDFMCEVLWLTYVVYED